MDMQQGPDREQLGYDTTSTGTQHDEEGRKGGGMHQPRRWRIGNRGRTYPVHPPLLAFLYVAHLHLLSFLVSYLDVREVDDDKEGC